MTNLKMFRHLLAVWSGSQWGPVSKSGGIQMGKRAPAPLGGKCGIPGHFYGTLRDTFVGFAWTELINAQS